MCKGFKENPNEDKWAQVNPSETMKSSESKWKQASPRETTKTWSETKWIQMVNPVKSNEFQWNQVSTSESKWN